MSNSSQNEECCSQKLYTKSKHISSVNFFFSKILPFVRMWKNMVQSDRSQVAPKVNDVHAK